MRFPFDERLFPTVHRTFVHFGRTSDRRTGPLTWSQTYLLAFIEALYPNNVGLNLRFYFPLRPGVAHAQVTEGLRDLMEGYEALRSLYLPTLAGPHQQVVAEGDLPVHVLAMGAGDREELVDAALRVLADVRFEHERELPLRAAVLTDGGKPSYIALVAHHLFVDFQGMWLVGAHLRDLIDSPPELEPPTAHQPLDEVEWQRSPAGMRAAAHALAHHERVYRIMPQTMLPRVEVEVDRPRFRYLEYDSPAAALAVAALTQRLQVSSTAVLFGGICAISAFVAGLPRAFLQLTLANRLDKRTGGAIGLYNQDSAACVDVDGATLSEVITRSATAVIKAVRSGRYPVDAVANLRRRVERDRGVHIDASCWLNHRQVRRWPSSAPPTRQELDEALARAEMRWADGDDSSTSTYFVHAHDQPDKIQFLLLFDAALIPPDEAVTWLRALEQVLCAAVSDDPMVADLNAYTALVPHRGGPGWHLGAAGWVYLPSVADLFVRLGVPAYLTVDDGRLVAHVQGDGSLDLAGLHDALVAALPGNRTAAAPEWYVVHARGTRPDSPVIVQGSGRS